MKEGYFLWVVDVSMGVDDLPRWWGSSRVLFIDFRKALFGSILFFLKYIEEFTIQRFNSFVIKFLK